ncbi:MAG: SET domain-containing protein-lysine N-methyltransferase [Alphaproteobacteria bacterium]
MARSKSTTRFKTKIFHPSDDIFYIKPAGKDTNQDVGYGFFTKQPFQKGDMVLRQSSGIIKKLAELTKFDLCYTTQVASDSFLCNAQPDTTAWQKDNYINHHCNPNTMVVIKKENQQPHPFLIARRAIATDEEITFDYSTTMKNDPSDDMICLCSDKHCRGTIKNFRCLPQDIKKKYIAEGAVPDFVLTNQAS